MKNVLPKYFKRIFFYLIPLFLISNQKYSTCDENFPFSNYPDFNEELDKICQQKKFLCIMVDAIKYSFEAINSFSQTYEEKSIIYQSTKSYSISCQNISPEIKNNKDSNSEDGKYTFSFSNCTSFIDGQLIIKNIKSYSSFVSELFIDKIIISMNETSLKGEMQISFEYDKTFNRTFDYDLLDEKYRLYMDKIMVNVFMNYTYQLKNIIELDDNQLLSQLKYFSDISNQFAKQYSFYSKKNDKENDITYIAYNGFKYNSLINIYDYIYIPNLVVFFEYALNYNITYNEGNLTFDYMNFSKSKNNVYVGNIINRSAEFEENISPEESNNIWEVIKTDFEEKFKMYK